MKRFELKVLFMACMGHFLCHTYLLIFSGALSSIEATFSNYIFLINGKSISLVSILGNLCYFAFGLGAFPAGLIANKLNAKLTLKLFYLCSAISALIIGIPAFFNNVYIAGHPLSLFTFSAGLVLLGLSGSLYHVSGLTLITQGIKVRGKAHGLHGLFGSFGIAFAPLIAGFITSFINWQFIYLFVAIPGFIGFIILMADNEIPKSHVHLTSTRHEFNSKKLALGFFIVFLIVMGLNGLIYRGFLTILPTYIKNIFSGVIQNSFLSRFNPKMLGGIITAVILSFGMIGQYTGGHLSEKFKKIRLYLIVILVTIPAIFLIGVFNSFYVIIPAIIFTIFNFSIQPIENYLVSDYSPPQFISSIYGLKLFIAFGTGSFASTFVIFIKDNYNISLSFTSIGILICITASLIILLNILDRKLKILK